MTVLKRRIERLERQRSNTDVGRLFIDVLHIINDGLPFSQEYFAREFQPNPPLPPEATIRDVLNSRPHAIQYFQAHITATRKYRADLAAGRVQAQSEVSP